MNLCLTVLQGPVYKGAVLVLVTLNPRPSSKCSVGTRLPSGAFIRRVTFLLFGFNKGTQKEKVQKGTTGKPNIAASIIRIGSWRKLYWLE